MEVVKANIRSVINKFKKALQEEGFPECKVYLFGSYARGDSHRDSDVDICLVSPLFKRHKAKYGTMATIIAYHVDCRIQVVVTDPHKFLKDPLSPLFSRIRKEAIAA